MGKNRTILLVDDEEKIVEVLQAYLEKAGYEVLCAYDGAAAMELFRNNDISLILLDLMLPDMHGGGNMQDGARCFPCTDYYADGEDRGK